MRAVSPLTTVPHSPSVSYGNQPSRGTNRNQTLIRSSPAGCACTSAVCPGMILPVARVRAISLAATHGHSDVSSRAEPTVSNRDPAENESTPNLDDSFPRLGDPPLRMTTTTGAPGHTDD